MSRKTLCLTGAFVVAALMIRGDVVRGASGPPEARLAKLHLSALRLVTTRLGAEMDRRLADAADGPASLDAAEEAALAGQLSRAQDLLARVGDQASVQDENSVRLLVARLRQLKGEPPISFSPAFGPSAEGGAVSGTVTDANTSAPLASASVAIYDCAGRLVTSAITNASGVYTTTFTLATGTYYSFAVKPGYIREIYPDVVYPPNGDVTTGTPINVTAGSTTSNVNYTLAPGGVITGTVTNANTAAAVGTSVYIYDASGVYVTGASSGGGGGSYTTTEGLPTGTYYATAYPVDGLQGELYSNLACLIPGFMCPATSGTPIPVTAGATTTGINFTLSPGGRIAGAVTATSGGAGLDGSVYIIDSAATAALDVGVTAAASGGTYLTTVGLPSGNYLVWTANYANDYVKELYNNILCDPSCVYTGGTMVPVTAGATTPGINFALDTAGGISGTIIDGPTSAPVSGVNVSVYTASGSSIRNASTNASGVYSILGLPTGNYYVRATPPGAVNYVALQYNNVPCVPCSATTGTPVAVTAPAVTPGINFTFAAGGTIAGRVTNAVSGAGIGFVGANAYSGTSSTGRSGTTACTGDYTISGLPTGSFRAVLTTTGTHTRRYRSELYDNLDCGTSSTCSISTGTTIPVTAGATTTNVNFDLVRYNTVADFNRDRKTDIGVYDPVSGIWFVRSQFAQAYGGPGATIVPGDYDGDLKTDMAVYYEAAGLWYVRRTTTGTDLVQGFGGSGYKPVPGDYDGDGKTDFAVFHNASGLWFVKQSSNGATTSFAFGSSGVTLVPADYDRDGKTDAAVYYEAAGLWYIRQSSSLITFSTGYGGTGYKPVRGDFDGDGRWDIAVYHNASSIWFIRNWGTGATTSVAFGGPGYIPVPGDYSGDSRADLAVYDPVSYLWFYRSVSGGGTTTVGFGGAGYIPVVIR